MINTDQISEDAIFKIGKVISVDGRTVAIKVDKTKNTSNLLYKGELLKNISVGGYIKIVKGFTRIVGKVEGEFITEDKLFVKKHYGSDREKVNRVLSISLLGFFKANTFERGIKEMPLIDCECFLLHKREFDQVHNFIKKGDDALTIGTLSLEKGQAIKVGVNGLFASHIGIFGNTGSGKSYTLAKIYRELFEKYKSKRKFKAKAKFFLIDFNGEYVGSGPGKNDIIVDKKHKNTFQLSTRNNKGDKFPIAIDTLNDPDFWVVFLEATEKTQTPFLSRAVNSDFIASKLSNEADLKGLIKRMVFAVTTEGDRDLEKTVVINLLKELSDCLGGNTTIDSLINDYNTHLKYNSTLHNYYYQIGGIKTFCTDPAFRTTIVEAKIDQLQINTAQIGPIDAIRLQIVLQYYDDIIRGFANKEHLSPLIKRLDKRIDHLQKVVAIKETGVFDNRKNIVIVSLRDVNVQMRKILPLLFCKKLYNDKKAENNDQNYLNIIIDEAHNILSEHSERESEQWKDYRLETFEEIIKEGRKFGVFLTVASQRPSDISPTIISQLHNYFLHRLINNEDIKAVEKTISYLDKVSFEYLPILPTGTCIVAGLLANIPVVIDIGKIEPDKHEPKNKTITLTDKWS
jgi:DNA helicase HerA-like ATPase